MTPSRYLERRVKRLEQKAFPHTSERLRKHVDPRYTPGDVMLARMALEDWVDARVRPSVTDTVWRPKRQGGPYRLEMR